MQEYQESIKRLLSDIGEEPDREGLQKTPYRVEKALREMTQGYSEDPAAILSSTFPTDSPAPVSLNSIRFSSLCEHHLMPFFGTIDITYKPAQRVVGISKLARLVRCFARRLQIQEQLGYEIASSIMKYLDCEWVEVRIKATHTCIMCRGIESLDATMITCYDSRSR